MKVKRFLVWGLCCAGMLAGCQQKAGMQSSGDTYPLLTVKPEDRQLSVKYSAVIEGKQDVEVRPQVSGTITRVLVEEGAHVRKGEVLFVIDQVPYKAALQKAVAAVATAEANEATAKQTLEGKELLFADRVISDFELHTAQNEYKSAQAALQQAQAELTDAQNNLSYTEVKSPVDGYAGMTSFRIGALVSSSMTEPLIRVSDNSQMYVYFSLTEKQVLALTAQYGSLDKALASFPEVSLELNDGSVYGTKGRVDVISGQDHRHGEPAGRIRQQGQTAVERRVGQCDCTLRPQAVYRHTAGRNLRDTEPCVCLQGGRRESGIDSHRGI